MVQTSRFRNRQPRRSLRTILASLFALFSFPPLLFVTGYSLMNFYRAIDSELVQRLRANVREVATTIGDYEAYLKARPARHRADPQLIFLISNSNLSGLRSYLDGSLRNSFLTTVSAFGRDGRLLSSYGRDENGSPTEVGPAADKDVYLQDSLLQPLQSSADATYIYGENGQMDLVSLTKLETKTGKVAGYIEEVIRVGPSFLEGIKKRLNIEIILFDKSGQIIGSSHDDLSKGYRKDFFSSTIINEPEVFFDLGIRGEDFKFIVSPIKWGGTEFIVGLGASKQRANAALRNVNIAFLTTIAIILVLILIAIQFSTRLVLRPLNDLVEGIQNLDRSDGPREIPVRSNTELGVLTESFNEMVNRIAQARSELENKIQELQAAYSELKDTQARLIHTAKMASVGQLVAGVAHELNNPIGFIFSNMSHLRDYSNRLIQIIEIAEKDPKQLAQAKADLDFNYVVQDLPRLIQSCEDGARRTRDIVLGLRNFSRLEEAKESQYDLLEGLEGTLRLLAGEFKNRIQIHTDFKPIPEITCYASHINQVFMNILTNAAQAIEGEGEIWIATQLVENPKTGARVEVSIRDSGKGMPVDIVDKIFDPFFTTKGIGQGTGLGLSITYGIVKKHGGDIIVKSEAGRGTEFIISLPVDGPPKPT